MLELARLVFLFLQVLLSPRYKTEHQLHHDQDTDYPQQQLTVYDVKDAESRVPEPQAMSSIPQYYQDQGLAFEKLGVVQKNTLIASSVVKNHTENVNKASPVILLMK